VQCTVGLAAICQFSRQKVPRDVQKEYFNLKTLFWSTIVLQFSTLHCRRLHNAIVGTLFLNGTIAVLCSTAKWELADVSS
jgi:hypothetical protein